MKYGDVTLGQIEALVTKLGGQEAFDSVLRGEKDITLTDAVVKLFNKHGCCIPPRGFQSSILPFKFNWTTQQPVFDYAKIYSRLIKAFNLKEHITLTEFTNRSRRIIENLRGYNSTAGILNGIHLPFCLPQLRVEDYGRSFQQCLIPTELAYKEQYGANFRNFYELKRESLPNSITIAKDSRHERLVEAMSKGPVVGIYFPNCMPGFTEQADRELIANLPEQFLLAGGFDTSAALIAHLDFLTQDQKNHSNLNCSALIYHHVSPDTLNFSVGGERGIGWSEVGGRLQKGYDFAGGALTVVG